MPVGLGISLSALATGEEATRTETIAMCVGDRRNIWILADTLGTSS